ncbi:MAG: hypothetical protein HUU50_08215 [Candidatus Brocadiae bacterium]|nr:hypothetical protein [Candidatus Brocadiia bacterium]
MKSIDIVVATEQSYINPPASHWRAIQVVQEDNAVVEAFQKLGFHAIRKGWDDPDFCWDESKCVLIRTTWNYSENFDKFQSWLNQVNKSCHLFNSLPIIQWNINKNYLHDMEQKGVNVVPTVYASSCISLKEVMKARNWPEIVIKPVVSAGALDTYLISYHDVEKYQPLFEKLVMEKEMMVQPLQKNILQSGEKSCIVFENRFSHAIRKIPKLGDFRVQEVYGGKVEAYMPNEEEKKFAEKAIACAPYPVQYARVDFTQDQDNNPVLMELELIEPELFFRFDTQAAMRLARTIQNCLVKNSKI